MTISLSLNVAKREVKVKVSDTVWAELRVTSLTVQTWLFLKYSSRISVCLFRLQENISLNEFMISGSAGPGVLTFWYLGKIPKRTFSASFFGLQDFDIAMRILARFQNPTEIHAEILRSRQRRNEGLPRLLCVVRFHKMAPVLRTWGECRGFSSSIFFETKRLSEVNKLDITSLSCYLLWAEYFVEINHLTYLFYDVLKSAFQTFCEHGFD